jgi:hypothetical protein
MKSLGIISGCFLKKSVRAGQQNDERAIVSPVGIFFETGQL